MSNIRFQGNPSGTGTLTIASPNTNSDFTLNLPTANGTIPLLATVTNNGVMFINGSGQPTSGSGLVFNSSGNLGIGTSSPEATLSVSGQVSESFTGSPTIVSKAYWTSNPADGGYFADYACFTSNFNFLSQSKNQSAESGGGIIDAQFVQQQDGDTVNYTAIGQKISNAVRGVTTGRLISGVFQQQYKDLVGGDFAAIGRISWNDRGVSGVLGQAIQYGTGIASNEFAVQNPSGANEQSVSMAAVQAIVRAQKGASGVSNKYRGVLVQNDQGFRATSAFEALSTAGAGSLTGNFEYGLHLSGSRVESAAITMPLSQSGNVGTIIEYDANDFTFYDRTNNRFGWTVNGNTGVYVTETSVGVGTASPSYPLQIARSGAAAYLANTDGTGTLLSGVNGSGLGVYGTFSNTAVALFSNSSERMRIDSSGNVGIGTSSPSTRLDVNGNIAGGSLNVFGTGVPANGINNVATNALGFFTNSVERARIDSSGNLLVNTATNTNSSRIVSNGVIESTSGGVRFPDGTTQTTAATSSTPWPGVYTGTTVNNSSYPIGTNVVLSNITGTLNSNVNASVTVWSPPSAGSPYFAAGNQGGGSAALAGTWRSRGMAVDNTSINAGILMQRVA